MMIFSSLQLVITVMKHFSLKHALQITYLRIIRMAPYSIDHNRLLTRVLL